MTSSAVPHRTSEEQLIALFGDDVACASAVLAVLDGTPDRTWRVEEIVKATGHQVVDVVIAVSRLTYGNVIEHPGPGQYGTASARIQRAG